MDKSAAWIFGFAGAANIGVAGTALIARPFVQHLLGLDPILGTNLWLGAFAVAMIGLFGVVYLLIARDPVAYRPCIGVSAAGKVLALSCAAGLWAAGEIGPRLPLLLSGDGVFALLFVDYLRRTAPSL